MGTERSKTRDGERGAVLAMVCVIMVVVIGCAAFAVDTGAAWDAKRQIRTATDAASLAAAGVYADGGTNGCATAGTVTTDNADDATVTSCAVVGQSGSTPGRVTVTAERPVDFHFAQIFGIDGVDVESSTTARFGYPNAASGLRPMGLCLYGTPALTAWMNLPTGPTGDSGTIRIPYNKEQPDACGGNEVPGNWGSLDFDGGNNSENDQKEWTENGYPDRVLVPSEIEGKPGALSNSVGDELASLIGKDFGIPVYDVAEDQGANATFHLVATVKVELVGFEVNGKNEDRYLDLKFMVGTLPGGGCCGGVINTGARAIDICAVDESFDTSDCAND